MSRKLVNVDRDTPMLLPCDLREWVAADDLVHFVVEAIEGMDLRAAAVNERGTGDAQYPPGMMLGLLVLSYAQGVFSSRKIERLTHQHVSFRYLCADTHPDHDTIARFRARNAALFEESFVAILRLARALKLVQFGTVHVDGTKLLADASKRRTLSLVEVEEQLELADRACATALLEQAQQADQTDQDLGQRLPATLADAAQRKAQFAAARAELAARAAAKKKPTVNPTDPDSRLMPDGRGRFIQGYNAQLAVDARGLIVGQRVGQASNDRTELAATAATIPVEPGEIEYLVADQGYDDQAGIEQVERALDTTVISPPQVREPGARPRPDRAPFAAQRGRRGRLAASPLGRDLLHHRQTTIEPRFGYLKHVLGFRRFHLRGLEKVQAEWSLLTTALNCRHLWQRRSARA